MDLSKPYLDGARRNLALNGFSGRNRLAQGDVMAWLEAERESYDLIFIGPPTFSNSKRMEGVFDVQRDHVQLLDLAMARLATGGVLYFSNNFRKVQLDEHLTARYAVEEITAQTLDPDFARNNRIHRAWRLQLRCTRVTPGPISGARHRAISWPPYRWSALAGGTGRAVPGRVPGRRPTV